MIFVLPKFWYNRYKANDALTLLFSALFIINISIVIMFNNASWTVVLLAITGGCLAYITLKHIKNEDDLSYLPFVPALGAGFLYYVMYVM